MRCQNCGKKIDAGAKFCKYCGKPVQTEVSQNEAKSAREHKHKNKKHNKPGRRVVAVVLAALILLGVGYGAFSLFANDGHKANESERFEAYYQEFTDEDVLFQDDELFVDSQLLLTAKSGTEKKTIETLAEEYGGEVVGYIEISDDYQIDFSEGKTLDELNAIAEEWNELDYVEQASLHIVFPLETSSVNYESDPWLPSDGSADSHEAEWYEDIPGGTNWWAEMIRMPSVWSMDTDFEAVRVGIFDTMFNTEHKDLDAQFAKVYCNPDNITNYHGSHVAGIIAAENNNTGITGISQNSVLCGYAYKGTLSRFESVFRLGVGIATLLNDGVKVINISASNPDEMIVSAQFDAEAGLDSSTSKAIYDLEYSNTSAEVFLEKCLKHYDFLIVKSAGNASNVKYKVNSSPDEKHPYSYVAVEACFERQNDILASNDFFADVEDPEIRSHVLVVGSVDLYYEDNLVPVAKESVFSNAGPDLYAPGGTYNSDSLDIEILSTTESTSGVEAKSGTSMAAPVVTGVASLVWGINPELTSTQVRTILMESATTNERFPGVVDALTAVQLAAQTIGNATENAETDSFGTVMGYAYVDKIDEETGELKVDIMGGIDFTLLALENGEYRESESIRVESDGTFTLFLEPGMYRVVAESTDYNAGSMVFEVKKDSVLLVPIKLESMGQYDLAQNAEMNVYDREGNLYDNYSVWIYELATSVFDNHGEDYTLPGSIRDEFAGPLAERDKMQLAWHFLRTDEVTDADSYCLDMAPGVYRITLKDNADEYCEYTFEVFLSNDKDENQLDIYTDFGLIRENSTSLYIPIVEAALEEMAYSGEGMLYDTDGDGFEELLLLYDTFEGFNAPTAVCTICDVEDGEVVFKRDRMELCAQIGGADCYVGIVERGGNKNVLIYSMSASDVGLLDRYWLFDGSDYGRAITYSRMAEYQYDDEGGLSSEVYRYEKDGESCAEEEFNTFVDSIEMIDMLGSSYLIVSYDEISAMSLEALLAYLRQNEDNVNDDEISDGNSIIGGYKAVLQSYPESTVFSYTLNGEVQEVYIATEYTLYDIDKDGVPELIIKEDSTKYDVYILDGTSAVLCGENYWTYSDCLYACAENGLIIHDGGIGNLHLEYVMRYELSDNVLEGAEVIIGTEDHSIDELYECLENYTQINDFYPIDDYSLLDNWQSSPKVEDNLDSKELSYPISEEDCHIIYKNRMGHEIDSDVRVNRYGSGDDEYISFEFYLNDSLMPSSYFYVYVNTGECVEGVPMGHSFTYSAEEYYY